MHDPSHTPPRDPPAPPVAPDRPAGERPARDVKEGAFDDSVAGEEDPGAGVDTPVPKPKA